MKIFSSFDTELSATILAEKQAQYGERSVLFIRRDPIYLAIKVYAPIIAWLVLSILIVLAVVNLAPQGGKVLLWLSIGSIALSALIIGLIATRKYIDYTMDYTIITPDEVLQYDQEGVLDRVSRSISVNKLKTISVRKGGLRGSVINYGSIVFFSEGDSSGSMGDIRLNYISDPTELKNKISRIVDVTLQE